MNDSSNRPPFSIPVHLSGQTVAGIVRQLGGNLSWAQARQLIASRRVRVNGGLCLDDARRLKEGEVVEVLSESDSPRPVERDVRILFADADLVVVEKPPGIQTVRRAEERDWSDARKQRQPVLQELVERMLTEGRRMGGQPLTVRAVHRLDRDTSGLMMFALSTRAEQELVRRFARHQIQRVYWAVVHGILREPRTIETRLVRDRGDRIRGSAPGGMKSADGQRAVTHVRPVEEIGGAYSVVECQLETGRTHQIRIHLAEIGHMLCGERVYVRPRADAEVVADQSGAPRQALHSAELQFEHPVSGKVMKFESGWPKDLARWIGRLREDTPNPKLENRNPK